MDGGWVTVLPAIITFVGALALILSVT